jgi:xylitol oxidase
VLRVQPTYDIRQYIYDDLPFAALADGFDEVMGSAYSVSAFTRWDRPVFEQVWRKQLADAPEAAPEWLGARLADSPRHMIAGMPTENATQQLGVVGAWHERLPHFRLEFTPSSGDEIQTEYLLPREQGPAALRALDGIRAAIAPALQISEIRTIAADEQWMSTAYGRDSMALHFTWVDDMAVVRPAIEAVEAAIADLDARPHWGKVFFMERDVVRSRFPRIADFEALVRSVDPQGMFANAFLRQYLDLP